MRARSGGICEGCGQRPATEDHHRQYRSRGGSDELSNLMHLCGWGNHSGCHGVAHTGEGEAKGWAVRSHFTPADVPVLTPAGWRRLPATPDHPLEPVPTPDAVEYMVLIGAIKIPTYSRNG
ncbi:MAG: HNH endonuclease [Planctomycetaceae bacterium]|nr:HNH endonuclease [Planctomycetaceae bacterium]